MHFFFSVYDKHHILRVAEWKKTNRLSCTFYPTPSEAKEMQRLDICEESQASSYAQICLKKHKWNTIAALFNFFFAWNCKCKQIFWISSNFVGTCVDSWRGRMFDEVREKAPQNLRWGLRNCKWWDKVKRHLMLQYMEEDPGEWHPSVHCLYRHISVFCSYTNLGTKFVFFYSKV